MHWIPADCCLAAAGMTRHVRRLRHARRPPAGIFWESRPRTSPLPSYRIGTSMFKRAFFAIGLMLWVVFASIVFAAQPGLTRLVNAPVNAAGNSEGVASFGGAMPSAAQVDGLRGLG